MADNSKGKTQDMEAGRHKGLNQCSQDAPLAATVRVDINIQNNFQLHLPSRTGGEGGALAESYLAAALTLPLLPSHVQHQSLTSKVRNSDGSSIPTHPYLGFAFPAKQEKGRG